jgi:glycosyltransferase 2 family protein
MPSEEKKAPATSRIATDESREDSGDVDRQPMPKMAPRGWIRWAKMAMVVIVAAGFAFAVQRAISHWASLPPTERWKPRDIHAGWLATGAALYSLSLFPSVLVLSRALRALGHHASLRLVVAAQWIGHLAKYVPGKAMVVIVRAAVLNRGRQPISLRAATIAISIETLTMIATGATIAFLMLLVVRNSTWQLPIWLKQGSLLLSLAAATATMPPFLRLVIARRAIGGSLSIHWTFTDVAITWVLNTLTWLLVGASTTALVMAIPPPLHAAENFDFASLFPICLTAIALSHVAGFLSLLPGGAGVRELVFTTLFSPMVGPSGAFLIAILIRLTQMACEALMAGVGALLASSGSKRAFDVDVVGGRD